MATIGEKVGFMQRMPMLMKATSDDEVPCPGYLFEEIAKISHESVGLCQCLLEYLLERLQSSSCHVKLKVLKILRHVCNHGSPQFTLDLRRNATLIQEVTVFSGPPDVLHGNALYQRVRTTAEDLANLLFSDVLPYQASCNLSSSRSYLQTGSTGMGSCPSSGSAMQGFGNTAGKIPSGPSSDAIFNKIQKAAEVMVNAVLPQDCPKNCGSCYHIEGYQPVLSTDSEAKQVKPIPKCPVARHSTKVIHHKPGLPGGGWEESDSGHCSQDSSQTNCISDGSNSKTSTDSQSGGSRESGDLMERVESINLNDCIQEITLVNNLIQGSKVFLTRDEMQRFIKECGLLNCEVVVELLNGKLKDPSHSVSMRSMSILSTLMCSDLLSHDQIFAITHKSLQQLSEGEPGPVTNRATKILRQFQALVGNRPATRSSESEMPLSISTDTSCNAVTPLTNFTSELKGKTMIQPWQFHPELEKTSQLDKKQELSLSLPVLSEGASVSQESQGPVFPSLPIPGIKSQHTEKVTEITSMSADPEKDQLHSEAQVVNPNTFPFMTKKHLHCESQERGTTEPKLQSVLCQSTASEDMKDCKLSLFADMVLLVPKSCLNQELCREMHKLPEQKKTPACSTTEVKLLHGNLGQIDSECDQPSVFSFLNTPSSSHSV
ncbi:AP-4 complex accessory subunit Tepsin [Stegostoma tigrinum]|uniref:AP-4 complex accessory subunit Tepsin n=1 Tax=Stegostoma tigrinum TaxID=3053191 RepID=UPI00202B8D3A|nr:AP-4 complex accessory subunit Tepsin [Stegostoma tigrinum]